jgi:hypothetical protein
MRYEFSALVIFVRGSCAPGERCAAAAESFVCDTIKIFLLPLAIIFVTSIIRFYFLHERTNNILSHKKEFIGNILIRAAA